jgi:hypothetical protein
LLISIPTNLREGGRGLDSVLFAEVAKADGKFVESKFHISLVLFRSISAKDAREFTTLENRVPNFISSHRVIHNFYSFLFLVYNNSITYETEKSRENFRNFYIRSRRSAAAIISLEEIFIIAYKNEYSREVI